MAKGIVPGSWLSLLRRIESMRAEEAKCNSDEKTDVQIFKRALESSAWQIAENFGADGGVIVARKRARVPDRSTQMQVYLVSVNHIRDATRALIQINIMRQMAENI